MSDEVKPTEPAPQPEPAKAAKPQPVADVVAHLAELMHRATQGEIVAVAVAGVQRGSGLSIVGWATESAADMNDVMAAVCDLDFALRDARAENSYLAPTRGQPKEASDGSKPDANAAG